MSQKGQKAKTGSRPGGGYLNREGDLGLWEFGTSFSEPAATAGWSNLSRRRTHGRLPMVNFIEPSSQRLQKMKATKAKRDLANTTSTKDYIVQGVKEDYDLDKVLTDLGEEPSKAKGSKAKGPKASGGSGSQKPEANVSQKVASKKGRRGAGPTSEATN